jgi:thiol-disulfide isomerase/thioredoxin
MNKKVFALIAACIILVAAAVGYLLLRPNGSTEVSTQTVTPQQQDQQTVTSEPAQTENQPLVETQPDARTGAYVDYSDTVITATTGTKILFFHAPWCSQCRAVEASIEAKGVTDGVTIIKVDYDTQQSLRQKYGVTLQTTFVTIDNNGNKIASYVAYQEPDITAVERELL